MVKEIKKEPGRTFSEFSLLTDYTANDCTIRDINLETILYSSPDNPNDSGDNKNLRLKIPFLSAAMTSVTGYDMALALGKEGGLAVLPVRMPQQDVVDIIKRIKSYEMSFVESPIKINENETIERVMSIIKEYGHSTIPVTDRNNIFLGMFTEEHYLETDVGNKDNIKSAMIGIGSNDILCYNNPSIGVEDAKKLLDQKNKNYLVVLDEQNRLVKLAFKRDIDKIKIGAAISTHSRWKERVEAIVGAGVDLVVVDTSDAYNEFTRNIIKEYKEDLKINIPLCVGNIITYDGAKFLMDSGADIIKVGMSSGSICSTQREKAVGRAPMSALIDVDKARKKYFKENRRDVPIIIDGGITSSADMIIALTIADAMMMGYYFNRFYEAAGKKLDKNRNETTEHNNILEVETWGEGSSKAQNLDRYGHFSKRTFFPEGEEGTVPYAGRLKPNLSMDLKKIRSALSNTGCKNLEEFRKKSVLEVLSLESKIIVSDVHHINRG